MIRTLFIIFMLSCAFNATYTNAKSCAYYTNRIHHLEDQRSSGGKASQMNRWSRQLDEAESLLLNCRKNQSSIEVAAAPSSNKSLSHNKISKAEHWKLRTLNTTNALFKKLIQTCNFWITQSNNAANEDNINFRNSACTAADKYTSDSTSSTITNNVNTDELKTRKLKDCMKPNNFFDNDVHECLIGHKEPTWNANL